MSAWFTLPAGWGARLRSAGDSPTCGRDGSRFRFFGSHLPVIAGPTRCHWLALAGVVVAFAAAGAAAAEAPANRWIEHRKLASRLAQWQAQVSQRGMASAAWAHQAGLDVDDAGRVRAELRLAVVPAVAPAVLQRLRAAGAELHAVGADRVDARLSSAALTAVLADPAVTWVAPPLTPVALAHPPATGARAIDAHLFHCAQQDGMGVLVAVVDQNFDLWAAAVAAGKLPHTQGTPPNSGDMHGTACAELIATIAPGATIVPVSVTSVASLQAWAAQELPKSGIAIVQHALAWFGESFGDGNGALCKLVSDVSAAGKVWVQAAGNLSDGQVWHDLWRDDNKDGWLEFTPGMAENTFDVASATTVQIILDWNAYPTTNTDLDLHLCRVLPADCSPVAVSTSTQDGSQPPVEALTTKLEAAGTYAIRVKHKAGPAPKLVRLQLPMAGGPLALARSDKTLVDPATCEAALAVAAIDVAAYGQGQVEGSSSRGPTFDLRPKPDIGAPSGVQTSVTDELYGTSAAAAHLSGALALWMVKSGQPAPAAAKQLLSFAIARPGGGKPDYQSGAGRLRLPADQAGVACAPGSVVGCTLPCGTSSTTVCADSCTPADCAVPDEVCDDLDQDCDGKTDEGFACRQGQAGSCTTACGSTGTRKCSDKCGWQACMPPAEVCNGKDDNCDGQTDDGFACAPGATRVCTINALEGSQACLESCSWAACAAEEVCNGKDDNGDGAVDDGLQCTAPEKGCAAGRPKLHGWWLLALAALGAVRYRRARHR